MAALTGQRDGVLAGLVDSDTFFERASRGERDAPHAAAAPDRAVGAASLPRVTPPVAEPDRQPRKRRARERVELRVPRARATAVGGVALVGLATVAVLVGGLTDRDVARSDAPADVGAEVAPRSAASGPVDYLGPRLGRVVVSARHVTGVVYDPGSGVRRIELVADGRRVAVAVGSCRPDCLPAARFAFDRPFSGRDELGALAVVAHDAAGNRSLLWQRLAGRRPRGSGTITARLEGADRRLAAGSVYVVGGKVADRAGRPVRGACVELTALSRTAAATPTRAAIVATDDAGRWRVGGLPASDGTRLYVARHIADHGKGATSRPVIVTVPVAITAHGRRLASGRRLVVGRVGVRARPGAIRLLLASRQRGGWRTESSAGARSGRRFALRVPVRVRGPVAVFVAPSPDLPYAPAGRVVDLARP